MSDLKTITDAIRADARMWDQQALDIGEVATAIQGLDRNILEYGIFFGFFGKYMDVISFLSARCIEGKANMADIADALVKNAKAYDDHEVETTKSVKDAY